MARRNIPISPHIHTIDMGFVDPYPEPEIGHGTGQLTQDIDTISGDEACRFSRFVYYWMHHQLADINRMIL